MAKKTNPWSQKETLAACHIQIAQVCLCQHMVATSKLIVNNHVWNAISLQNWMFPGRAPVGSDKNHTEGILLSIKP